MHLRQDLVYADGFGFLLPNLPPGKAWRRFVDTSLRAGEDAVEPGAEAPVAAGRYGASPRSVVVLVGR